MEGESRTEKATPKKRRDERKKGNVFQSKDVIAAVSTLMLFVTLRLLFPFIYKTTSNQVVQYIEYINTIDVIDTSFAVITLKNVFITLFELAGPLMLVAMGIGIISSGVQTRFIMARESIKFKLSNLNPISGIKRLISLRAIIDLIKSILKVIIICVIFYMEYKKIISGALKLIMVSPLESAGDILIALFNIIIKVCVVFIAIAAADYLYEWWEHEKKLKMTKQEIKEEYKHTEGDPQIKGRIRDIQRSRAQQRMMQNVPTADVIVRNPTHIAIALKYNAEQNAAPVVVAKGADYVAMKIIEEAAKYEIPMMENKPLARALYKKVPLGREVPPEYYTSVAEVLAWVYSLKKEVKQH